MNGIQLYNNCYYSNFISNEKIFILSNHTLQPQLPKNKLSSTVFWQAIRASISQFDDWELNFWNNCFISKEWLVSCCKLTFEIPLEHLDCIYQKIDEFTLDRLSQISSLHAIAYLGCHELLDSLSLTENVNAQCEQPGIFFGSDPLTLAFEERNIEVFRWLLEKQASLTQLVNQRDLLQKCALIQEYAPFVRLLLKNRFLEYQVASHYVSALHVAAIQNNVQFIDYLIEHGANVNLLDQEEETALSYACRFRNRKMVSRLLMYDADPNIKLKFGKTALDIALATKQATLVKLLLTYGAKINDAHIQQAFGNEYICKILQGFNHQIEPEVYFSRLTSLTLLLDKKIYQERGHHFLASLFSSPNFNPNIIYAGRPLLHAVLLSGSCFLLNLLLKREDLNLTIEDHNGVSALQLAVCLGNEELVSTLLKNGMNPNLPSSCKIPPLHIAADRGDYKIAELLLKYHASLIAQDSSQFLAYHYAALNKGYVLDLVHLLKPTVEHEISPALVCLLHRQGRLAFAKELYTKIDSLTKQQFAEGNNRVLLAHMFEIKGSSTLVPRHYLQAVDTVNLEGYYFDRLFLLKFKNQLRSVDTQTLYQLSKLSNTTLLDACDFSLRSAEIKDHDCYIRIKSQHPTFIYTGWRGHAVQFLFWKNSFVICNLHHSIKVYTYDPNLLTEVHINKIRAKPHSQFQYETLVLKLIHELHATTNASTEIIEQKSPCSPQIVGNCVKASLNAVIWSLLALIDGPDAATECFQLIKIHEQLRQAIYYLNTHLTEEQIFLPDMKLCNAIASKLDLIFKDKKLHGFSHLYQSFLKKFEEVKKLNFPFVQMTKHKKTAERTCTLELLQNNYYLYN